MNGGLIGHCKHVEPSGKRNSCVVVEDAVLTGVTSGSFAEISQNVVGSLRGIDVFPRVEVVDWKQME